MTAAMWFTPFVRAMEITGVRETQRSWHIRWVERFEKFLQEKPIATASREDVESFISSLRSEPDATEWKIDKATDALRLLVTAVYGSPGKHPQV